MRDRLPMLNTVLLVVLLVAAAAQGVTLSSLGERLDAVEASAVDKRPVPSVTASAPDAPRTMPHVRSPRPAAGTSAAPERVGKDRAVIDDHLWSDEGRAAIDDVVESRETSQREAMRARWRELSAVRTERAVERVVDELQLDETTAGALVARVTTYAEERSSRWRRLHDGDADMTALHDEGEESRANFERDVEELLGTEGLTVLLGAMERRHGF